MLVLICFVYGFFLSLPLVYGEDGGIDNVLSSAESLFKSLKARNYTEVWKLLTVKSRKTIVDDVSRETAKLGSNISEKQLNDDFASGGPLAKAYWDSYIDTFDPDVVLEHSAWTINVVKNDYSEINILYKKSEKPAILKLFKEGGVWKVGLEETFRVRKWFIY